MRCAVKWYIGIPFSKSHMSARCADNLLRQKWPHADIELCIVENAGATFDAEQLRRLGVRGFGVHVLRLESRGVSPARNAAVAFFKRRCRGRDWITQMDCDDFYGASYLQETADAMKVGRLVGKPMAFVFDRGLMLVNPRELPGPITLPDSLSGACQAAHVADMRPYPLTRQGEDGLLCDELSKAGIELYRTSIYHYCYMRDGGEHTWKIDIRKKLYAARREIIELGAEFNSAIVTGETSWELQHSRHPEKASSNRAPRLAPADL